jgi:hypothetical protein
VADECAACPVPGMVNQPSKPPPPPDSLVACGQDVLVYAPAVLIFFEAVVPLFVRHKIREELDAARKEPIAFKHQIPQGKLVVATRRGISATVTEHQITEGGLPCVRAMVGIMLSPGDGSASADQITPR